MPDQIPIRKGNETIAMGRAHEVNLPPPSRCVYYTIYTENKA